MKCSICDREDQNIWIDVRDGSWQPCYVCQEIINDAAHLGGDDLEERYILDEEPADVRITG